MPNFTKNLAEIKRIASSNEFWTLPSGEHLNMIDSLLEHIKKLETENHRENRRLREALSEIHNLLVEDSKERW